MPISNTSLSAGNVQMGVLIYADFSGDPLRIAYAPMPLTVPVSITDGDADCQNFTFENASASLMSIDAVTHGDGGTDTLTVSIAADPLSPGLLNAIENPSLYAGRVFRIWQVLHNGAGTVTELQPLYTGYMSVPSQTADASTFVITMQVENYKAILSAPPARSYLNQSVYDASDLSANVSLGSGNAAPGIVGGGMAFGRDEFVQYQ